MLHTVIILQLMLAAQFVNTDCRTRYEYLYVWSHPFPTEFSFHPMMVHSQLPPSGVWGRLPPPYIAFPNGVPKLQEDIKAVLNARSAGPTG